ncbi:MAG: hypothetical protein ACYC3A_11095, partial [Halothiobacillus sp.]
FALNEVHHLPQTGLLGLLKTPDVVQCLNAWRWRCSTGKLDQDHRMRQRQVQFKQVNQGIVVMAKVINPD